MFRRQSVLYSPERVERFRAFCDLLIEAAILRRERLTLVKKLRPLLLEERLVEKINNVVKEGEDIYPGYTINVSLMHELGQTEFGNDPLKVFTP